ncbi:MAG: xanthine dehydrogenase molybdopterin binding subunit [Myxococcales bacterium]|nr:xanthine dehydrogenase molybdopterin binding subunit [Myxococcales bacterium]
MSRSPLHRPAPHESAEGHVSGSARYVDDMALPPGSLVGLPIGAPIARGRVTRRERGAALQVPGVHAVLFADDLPAERYIGPVIHDEPILAIDAIDTVGQIVALVVGESLAACRAAASLLEIDYEEAPPILSIEEGIAAGDFLCEPHRMQRGDVDAALAGATLRLTGEVRSGAQDHFYLETQASLAIPGEADTYEIHSSSQHPTEVQTLVAAALGIGRNQVVVKVPRMGGGFGGKESQAAPFAVLAALAARATGRAVKVWLNRDQDMVMTGKRHPFLARYDAGVDAEGRIVGARIRIYADGGWSRDLSTPILDRAMFHLDNAYWIPALDFEGIVVRTNKASNTAFRGFGGPQGMVVIEEILARVGERLGIEPAELRRRNFYREGQRTPYDQELSDVRLQRIYDEVTASSDYFARRAAIDAFNARSELVRRGIALQPVKFGISFTNSVLNQAGALVLVYTDGTVQVNHGGTEMGQGLHTKMRAIAAHELGVRAEAVRVMETATDKVPNTSATAASSGSDLNGAAVKEACEVIRGRLGPVAAGLLGLGSGDEESLVFEAGKVRHPASQREVDFVAVVKAAWAQRVSLHAAGYYSTPGIGYDRAVGRGKPFHYYAYGAAVIEVEVHALTGEHRVRRVDVLHDVGNSLVPTIDRGQIEGGFVQGLGWLTCEEVLWDDKGRLLTHGPSTYKIPAIGDVPVDFRVELLSRADQGSVIHGSKAVGEPPFMLAIGVVTALRQAIATWGRPGQEVELAIPCTPEAILRAIEGSRSRAAEIAVAAE